MLRQVLESGNEGHAVTALRLQPARLEQSKLSEPADAKAVNSLHSAPHSKTLTRGTQVHECKGAFGRATLLRRFNITAVR